MPESSEDIIEETPPRKLRKRYKKRNKTDLKITHQFEDYWIDLRDDFKEDVKIDRTRVGSDNRPYVYRTIEELLDFSETCFPKNNSTHLVGVFKYRDDFGYCLVNNCPDSKYIQLDMKLVNGIPSNGEFISAYGSLEYKEGYFRNLIFIVKFYRPEASALVNDYKKNLKLIRCFVPGCHLLTMSLRP